MARHQSVPRGPTLQAATTEPVNVPPSLLTVSMILQIYSVDVATGTDIKRLTTATGSRTGGMGGKPSPCGKYLAFASDRDVSMQQGLFDIYVLKLNAEGLPAGTPTQLTWGVANQYSRSWSPDSKYLAFNSQVSDPQAQPQRLLFAEALL